MEALTPTQQAALKALLADAGLLNVMRALVNETRRVGEPEAATYMAHAINKLSENY